MPTFIDESGDTGSVAGGSSLYFRLAAVWIPTLEHAQALREPIRQLRRDLGLRTDYEFKYAKTQRHTEWRRAFFRAVLAHEFRFTVCSIDKTDDDWDGADGAAQHWACATTLSAHLRERYHHAEEQYGVPLREPIVVDDNADADFLRIVKAAFRGLHSRLQPGSSLVGKVSFRKSSPEELLQLVDMICGAAGAYIDEEDGIWYAMVAKRDVGTVRLP